MKKIPLFVYGTLMTPSVLDMLRVAPIAINPATLKGYKKDGLNIIEDENSEVNGHYFLVDESEFKTLDSYEGYGHLYTRFLVNVSVNGDMKRAYVYQLIK